MIKSTTNTPTITRQLVPEDQRLPFTAELFGIHFPLRLEPTIYGITARIAPDYHGGYWDFYVLDNRGFYMAPAGDQVYQVACFNHWQGELSADASLMVAVQDQPMMTWSQFRAFANTSAQHALGMWPSRDSLVVAFVFQQPDSEAIVA